MKRQSLRSYSARRSLIPGTPAVFATGGLILFILIMVLVRVFAPNAFTVVVTPFWRAGSALSASVGVNTASWGSKEALVRERDALAAQNAQLTSENQVLAAKAQDLQQLLGTRTQTGQGILAGVLARPPVAPYDVLIVDQGSISHVTLGAVAYGPGGTPIGTVGSVTNQTARITLFSNPGLETAGWVGDARIPVTIRGAGSGAFTATLPKAAGIIAGQGVYAAGPGAVPVGVVTRIQSDPSSPNVILDIHPYLNPFSLTWVTIGPAL
jgi:cell shape-determining protein MreC